MLNAYVSWSPDSVIEQAFSVSLDELCLDVSDYAQTALPACVRQGPKRVFVHAGLFAEHKLHHLLPQLSRGMEVERPHPNLQERFFALGADVLISNVIGATRLLHNLTLLRLIGIEHNKISVVPEQIDFASEYRYALANLGVNTPVRHAAFCFGGEALVAAWLRQAGKSAEVSRCSGPLLRAVHVGSEQGSLLVVHLTSVYGSQLIPFVDLLYKEFGLEHVYLFGACGALNPGIAVHDTVFVRAIRHEDGSASRTGNELLPFAARFPAGLTGRHASHISDVASVPCIPQETYELLGRLAAAGVSAVDLELGPLARYLCGARNLRWGAALQVSDRPMAPSERLGSLRFSDHAEAIHYTQTHNQAMILASRTAPHASIVRRDSPALDWTTADRCGALHILETILPSRDGEAITIHAALLPLERLAMVPAVNSVGQNYQWQDETVRGMCLWDDAHMLHMNTLLRRTAKQYLDDIDDTQDTIAVLNGNGNLFWNLGHFVYLKPVLYQHSREHLHGRHTALVQDSCGLRLDVVDVCALSRDVEFAVSGLRILRRGEVVDLLARDPDTGRPAVCDYYGDLTHVVHGFRLSLSLSRSLFSAASQIVDQDATIRYAKSEILNTYIQDAVCGYPISSVLAPDEDSSSVLTSLARFGYVERSLGEPLVPGTYALGDDGLLSIAYRRGTLGHSVIASTEDPGILLLVNSYTNPSRKGFTLEDTARLVTRVASSLGQRAQDALVLSSSGDVRIVLGRKNDLRCLEQNKRGETLLFKGGLEYGLSNALIITAKT